MKLQKNEHSTIIWGGKKATKKSKNDPNLSTKRKQDKLQNPLPIHIRHPEQSAQLESSPLEKKDAKLVQWTHFFPTTKSFTFHFSHFSIFFSLFFSETISKFPENYQFIHTRTWTVEYFNLRHTFFFYKPIWSILHEDKYSKKKENDEVVKFFREGGKSYAITKTKLWIPV